MAGLAHLLVESDAPIKTVIHPYSKSIEEPLLDGQVLIHVAKLVVTANTLTYALAGKMPVLTYFKHFPIPKNAPDTLAMTPCWGTGIVVESKCTDVQEGTRVHGYFPFSPTVALTPANVKGTSFTDAAPHRSDLLMPYKTYFSHEDRQFKGMSYDEEDYQMAMGVLFNTGWGMAQVAASHPGKPTALILTSASSRTSRAAAFAAQFHGLPLEIIGLTSAAHVDYVRGLGLYSSVYVYSDIASIEKQKVAVQDVAGDSKVQESIYTHFGDDVVYFGRVGMAHVGSAGRIPKLAGLGGSSPEGFLVFSAIEQMNAIHGAGKVKVWLADASKAFNAKMLPEFRPERKYGAEETRAVFDALARGQGDPEVTYVCSMWPKESHDPQGALSKL